METQMKINGDAVRALREQKAWSQEHLAGAAGVSVRTVQRVEAEGIASAETRLALAAALDVPVAALQVAELVVPSGRDLWTGIPRGAWLGLGFGAACAIGAVLYTGWSGAATTGEVAGRLGVICGLLGATLGVMGAVQGWVRGRAQPARSPAAN